MHINMGSAFIKEKLSGFIGPGAFREVEDYAATLSPHLTHQFGCKVLHPFSHRVASDGVQVAAQCRLIDPS